MRRELLHCIAVLLAVAVCSSAASAQEGRSAAAQPAGADAPANSVESSGPSKAAIERTLRRYGREPKVAQVVAEALRHGELGIDRVQRLVLRSRHSGLLPEVSMGVRRQDGRRRSEVSTLGEPVRLTADAGFTLDASISFHLERLVYGRDELALERHRRSIRQDRDEAARIVVELYYLRRRLQLERDLVGATVDGSMRLAEAQAMLDALTGGVFAERWLP